MELFRSIACWTVLAGWMAGSALAAESPVKNVGFPRQPVLFLPSASEWASSDYSEQALIVRTFSDAHLSVALRGVADTDHQQTRTVEFMLEGTQGRYLLWAWDEEGQVYQNTVAVPCDQTVMLALLLKPSDMKQLKEQLPVNSPVPFRLMVRSRVGADCADLGEIQVIHFDRIQNVNGNKGSNGGAE